MSNNIPLHERLTVTVNQACQLTGFGKTTMFRLIAEEKVKSRMVEGRRLIAVASLKSLVLPEDKAA